MKGIPNEFYEAAAIDGANNRQQFFNITLPLLSPVIFFNLVMRSEKVIEEARASIIAHYLKARLSEQDLKKKRGEHFSERQKKGKRETLRF